MCYNILYYNVVSLQERAGGPFALKEAVRGQMGGRELLYSESGTGTPVVGALWDQVWGVQVVVSSPPALRARVWGLRVFLLQSLGSKQYRYKRAADLQALELAGCIGRSKGLALAFFLSFLC